jgi:TolB protein
MKYLGYLCCVLAVAVAPAYAQVELDVRGAGKLIPIALPQLCDAGGAPSQASEIPETIRRDLDISGYFEVLNPKAFIETAGKCGPQESTVYSDWSVVGAEGIGKGQVTVQGGRIKAQLYLHDVQKQGVVLAKEYEGDISQARMIAHKFANDIMKHYTGFPGVFGTQIAFSSKIGRFKELFVMDMDGSNIRQLTNDRSLSQSAAWDPSGTKIVFMSYRNRTPDLFSIDVATRALTQITKSEDLEVGPHFFGPGQLIVSRTEGIDSELVLMGLNGGISRRLTPPNRAIDVSGFPSPDGSQVVFCSNRGGSPQIYMMGSDGGNARRISFVNSSYCTSPAWSPKGDKIAFVCRADGNFQTFVADADGGNAMQITASGSTEDPEFSPDGRYLVASSTHFGGNYNIVIMRADGMSIKQVSTGRQGDFEPAWGPMP